MDAIERLLELSPTLDPQAFEVGAEDGAVVLRRAQHAHTATLLRLSRLEWQLAQRLTGVSTVRAVLAQANAGGVSVSPQALCSLCGQLADAGFVRGWPRNDAAGPPPPDPAAIDEAERAFVRQERQAQAAQKAQASASELEPPAGVLAQAAQKMLLAVAVDERELTGMARQAIARLRKNERSQAAQLMHAASELAAEAGPYGGWARLLTRAATEPQRPAATVLAELYALDPQAARKLYDTTPSAPVPGGPPTEAPAWYEPEGTLGLPSPPAPLGPPLGQARQWATSPATRRQRRVVLLAFASLVGLVGVGALASHLWLPAVAVTRHAPAPYRARLPSGRAALAWPRSVVVSAPAAGIVQAIAAQGARVEQGTSVARLGAQHGEATPPRTLLRWQRETARLQAQLAKWSAVDPSWAGFGHARKLARARARLQQLDEAFQGHRQREEARAAAPGVETISVPAPFSAEVTAVAAALGDAVRAGNPLVTLTDRRLPRLVFAAKQFSNLRIGDAVALQGGAEGDEIFSGHVVAYEPPVLPPTGAVDRAARARRAGGEASLAVDVADPNERIGAALAARLALLGDSVPFALRVPAASLERDGESAFVWWVTPQGRLAREPATIVGREGETAVLAWPDEDPVEVATAQAARAVGLGTRVRTRAAVRP